MTGKTTWVAAIVVVAAATALCSCSRTKSQYRASIDVTFHSNVMDPLAAEPGQSTNWIASQEQFVTSGKLFGAVVDVLHLEQRWSVSKLDAARRLQAITQFNPIERAIRSAQKSEGGEDEPRVVGWMFSVTGGDSAECEEVVSAIAGAFKAASEEQARTAIDERIARDEAEVQTVQEKLKLCDAELQQLQTNFFVPSEYHLSPAYEAELNGKIQDAAAEESAREEQLDSLRKLQGEPLRLTLVKLELARLAAASPSGSSSVLVSADQAEKEARKELEIAQGGGSAETNAVGHAQIKLEMASQSLTNSMDAFLKSLDIELAVAKGRRQELDLQLGKLKETSARSERKSAIAKDLASLNARTVSLRSEMERWKLSQRILTETIHLGPTRVEPFHPQ